MTNEVFALALACGAAALALWVHVRAPKLEPGSLRVLALHAVVAFVLMQLIPASGGSVAFAYVVVFAVALPLLVYAFLVAIWFLRLLQNVATSMR